MSGGAAAESEAGRLDVEGPEGNGELFPYRPDSNIARLPHGELIHNMIQAPPPRGERETAPAYVGTIRGEEYLKMTRRGTVIKLMAMYGYRPDRPNHEGGPMEWTATTRRLLLALLWSAALCDKPAEAVVSLKTEDFCRWTDTKYWQTDTPRKIRLDLERLAAAYVEASITQMDERGKKTRIEIKTPVFRMVERWDANGKRRVAGDIEYKRGVIHAAFNKDFWNAANMNWTLTDIRILRADCGRFPDLIPIGLGLMRHASMNGGRPIRASALAAFAPGIPAKEKAVRYPKQLIAIPVHRYLEELKRIGVIKSYDYTTPHGTLETPPKTYADFEAARVTFEMSDEWIKASEEQVKTGKKKRIDGQKAKGGKAKRRGAGRENRSNKGQGKRKGQ